MTINQITREDIKRFAAAKPTPHNTLNSYQQIATKSAIYPGRGSALGLAYVALKLNGEAGEFAEHVGKAMRDDGLTSIYDATTGDEVVVLDGRLNDSRRALVIKEIGDVLWYLSAACNELGISLSDAALINLEKLCDRTERNVLRGSGDER